MSLFKSLRATPADDCHLVPSSHTRQYTSTVTAALGDLTPLSSLHRYLLTHDIHVYPTQTYYKEKQSQNHKLYFNKGSRIQVNLTLNVFVHLLSPNIWGWTFHKEGRLIEHMVLKVQEHGVRTCPALVRASWWVASQSCEPVQPDSQSNPRNKTEEELGFLLL